ncbi:helix-turn-helix domain-containing protein (plasmid) [Photobacterium leiognathi subsp. mandapamensis]
MTIGNNKFVPLSEFRKKAKLTQQELADPLGIDQSMISFLENGRRRLDPTKVKQVSLLTSISKCELRLIYLNKVSN